MKNSKLLAELPRTTLLKQWYLYLDKGLGGNSHHIRSQLEGGLDYRCSILHYFEGNNSADNNCSNLCERRAGSVSGYTNVSKKDRH
jgi:hypothetical protein